jgi:hypothetical protein
MKNPVSETDRLAPIAEQIWRNSFLLRSTESGRMLTGLIVDPAPWIYWDRTSGRLGCERCTLTEKYAFPLSFGTQFVLALADVLTPWKEAHAACLRKVPPS